MKRGNKRTKKAIWIVLAVALALVFAVQGIGLATENFLLFDEEATLNEWDEPIAQQPEEVWPNDEMAPDEIAPDAPELVIHIPDPIANVQLDETETVTYYAEEEYVQQPVVNDAVEDAQQPVVDDAVEEPIANAPESVLPETEEQPQEEGVLALPEEEVQAPEEAQPMAQMPEEDIITEDIIVEDIQEPDMIAQEAYIRPVGSLLPASSMVIIKNAPASMASGTHKTLKAQVKDLEGNTLAGVTYKWHTSGGAIAINPNTGYIRAKQKGTSVITVQATLPNGLQMWGNATIRVNSSDVKNRITVNRGGTSFGTYVVKKGTNERINVRKLAKKMPEVGSADIRIKYGEPTKIRYTLYDLYSGKMVYKNAKTLGVPASVVMGKNGEAVYPGYVVRMTYIWDKQVYYYYFKLSDTKVVNSRA